MKKLLLIPLLLLTVLSMAACGGGDDEPFRPGQPETPDVSSLNVNITVGDRTVTATMEDNAAARDFLSRLPLEITLNDYNNMTEKIFYPDPALAEYIFCANLQGLILPRRGRIIHLPGVLVRRSLVDIILRIAEPRIVIHDIL